MKIPAELYDFRNFLYLVWKHLKLPDPTPAQYEMAYQLQHGNARQIILAFRGAGKSYITGAFVVWLLLLNNNFNILVVSASKDRSDAFSIFTKRLIHDMPLLQHLKARSYQRDSSVLFDVGPSNNDQSPSVKAVGITGALTGTRADVIIADDVESLNNSDTQGKRDKLGERVKEFDSIIKPNGRIVYLGTYQTEMSLYKVLPSRGYHPRVWTARYPSPSKLREYGSVLAPSIIKALRADPSLEGVPTDTRFTDDDLLARALSYGRSGFALQFMLDPSLADADKYPLRLRDFIVMSIDRLMAPEKVMHSNDPTRALSSLPAVGLSGDGFFGPLSTSGELVKYRGTVMTIDPSGRGKDETGYCIASMLHGYIYIHKCGGFAGGYEAATLQKLADLAKEYDINEMVIESNFGDGMFDELFRPYLNKTHPVTITPVRHSSQKEPRIIDSIEPLLNQHRLIISPDVIEDDYNSVGEYTPEEAPQYRLFHQLSRITNARGALAHDDRLEALAMATHYWVEQVGQDVDDQMEANREETLLRELDSWHSHVFGEPENKSSWL